MLTIKREQLAKFQAFAMEEFIERLQGIFAEICPDGCRQLGPHYHAFIEGCVTRALSYGIQTEQSVARFANLCFTWGMSFETLPEHGWALAILTDVSTPGAEKVEKLVQHTKASLEG